MPIDILNGYDYILIVCKNVHKITSKNLNDDYKKVYGSSWFKVLYVAGKDDKNVHKISSYNNKKSVNDMYDFIKNTIKLNPDGIMVMGKKGEKPKLTDALVLIKFIKKYTSGISHLNLISEIKRSYLGSNRLLYIVWNNL
jgi:hypothetical protein